MGASAVGILLAREELPALYGAEPDVAALAVQVFPLAAAFQLADGVQVVGGAVLRGLGRPRPAAVLNLLGYYVLALPLAYFLAFAGGRGLEGLWLGLTLGLFVVAFGVLPLTLPGAPFERARPLRS